MTRVCLGAGQGHAEGCNGYTTKGSRSIPCNRAWDKARRPNFRERGYDRFHDQARRRLSATLPALCAYGCGTILATDGRWVAAHVIDGDPGAGWVASCYACNERAKN